MLGSVDVLLSSSGLEQSFALCYQDVDETHVCPSVVVLMMFTVSVSVHVNFVRSFLFVSSIYRGVLSERNPIKTNVSIFIDHLIRQVFFVLIRWYLQII